MQNLEKIRQTYTIIVGVITSFVTPYLLSLLQDSIANSGLRHLVIIILIGISLIVLNLLLEHVINNSAGFRKLISPKSFIEGFWYDTTFENEKLRHVVIMNIFYEKGGYVVHAEYFNAQKQHIGNFTSMPSIYHNNELLFRVDLSYLNYKNKQSIDYLKFNSPPSSYIGYYIDLNHADGIKQIEVQGTRIKSKTLAAFNNFREIEDKGNFVEHLIKHNNIAKG